MNALQHFGRFNERDVLAWQGSLSELGSVTFPKPDFVCAFVLGETDWSSHDMSGALRAILDEGGVYFLFHGRRCEDACGLVDRLIVERNPRETDGNVMLTTAHERESLRRMVAFALLAAIPAEDYVDGCKSIVFVSVAEPRMNAFLQELLTHPSRTIQQWTVSGTEEDSKRDDLKKKYCKLFAELTSICATHDPIGIIFDDVNPDEYEPEVGTVLPRLRNARSEADCEKIIREEFVEWFGVETIGPRTDFRPIAHDVWRAWSAFQASGSNQAEHGFG